MRSRVTKILLLQVLHLGLLFLIPILWYVITQTSGPEDTVLLVLTWVVGLSEIVWLSVTVVLSIIYGDSAEGIKKIFSFYRRLLTSTTVLLIFDIGLVVIVLALTFQVLAYRQVEFNSPLAGQLKSNDAPDDIFIIGRLAPNESKRFRLRTGTRHLVFQTDNPNSNVPLLVKVRPWWEDLDILHVEIPAKDEPFEELR